MQMKKLCMYGGEREREIFKLEGIYHTINFKYIEGCLSAGIALALGSARKIRVG